MATLAREMMQLATGRLIDPREIADAVAVLASPRSASVAGAELVDDAGMVKTGQGAAAAVCAGGPARPPCGGP